MATQQSTEEFTPIAPVISFGYKPRPEIKKLHSLVGKLSESGIAQITGAALHIFSKHPRFPLPPSMTTEGISEAAEHLLRIAELISTDGLRELALFAGAIDAELPRQRMVAAKVINFTGK
ncbi:MAG TPA: hypothetical protein PLU47_08030 [Azonexus sp.]|nr:hypothetical protein [Azonexus sp.]